MCPTVLGRVQTRWAILIIPAILAAIVSLVTQNEGWIVLIGLYFVIGVALDTCFYPFIIRWQPPWLTFTLAFGEFILVFIAAHFLKVGLTNLEAILEYWIVWWIAICRACCRLSSPRKQRKSSGAPCAFKPGHLGSGCRSNTRER